MKIMKFVLLILAILQLTLQKAPVSQSTRNYRKTVPNPSFNPLPNNWQTGPRNSLPLQRPDKYHAYNSKLHNAHKYLDKSAELRQKARARMILQ